MGWLAGEEPGEAPRHCTTGRLDIGQADWIDAVRARLAEDRPSLGKDPVSGPARALLGADDRPRTSTSDIIAAAIDDMLSRRSARPAPLDLAAYAYRARRAARPGEYVAGVAPPECPPATWYARPGQYADIADLCDRARDAAAEKWHGLPAEAAGLYPYPPGVDPAAGPAVLTVLEAQRVEEADASRRWHEYEQIQEYGLWYAGARVPPGAVARRAIDLWADRDIEWVIAAGVSYAEEYHEQRHRARKDVGRLGRGGPAAG
jgi:hypothetical protein